MPARESMPALGPIETLVWEEIQSFRAYRQLGSCLCVLYHPACKDRPLCLGPPPSAIARIVCMLLRPFGLRCFVTPLTPLQLENRARIARFLARSWRPVLTPEPPPNARMIAVITYPPWAGERELY